MLKSRVMNFIQCESCSWNAAVPATGPRVGQGKYLLKGISQGSLWAKTTVRHKYALTHELWARMRFPRCLLRNNCWKVPRGEDTVTPLLSVIYQINTYLSSSKQASHGSNVEKDRVCGMCCKILRPVHADQIFSAVHMWTTKLHKEKKQSKVCASKTDELTNFDALF